MSEFQTKLHSVPSGGFLTDRDKDKKPILDVRELGTDAYSAGLTPVDEATAEMCGQVIYPAAVLKTAPNAETAKEFLAYLQTDRAATVFEGVGFTAM